MTTSRTAASAHMGPLMTLLTGLAGVAAGVAENWGLAGEPGSGIVGVPIEWAASSSAAPIFARTMLAKAGAYLHDAPAILWEDLRGRPQQHRRADTPCQRG